MSHLSTKKPSLGQIVHLDTLDTAFLIMTGNVRLQSPLEAVTDITKASVDVVLYGPQARLMARVLTSGWSIAGGDNLTEAIRLAFTATDDWYKVDTKKIASAFKFHKNIGKRMWSKVNERVGAVVDTTLVKADKHFDRQLTKTVEKQASAAAAMFDAAALDNIEYWVGQYPDRQLRPRVQRLVQLAQQKEGFRMVDRLEIKDRLDRLHMLPRGYFNNMADVEVGRAWQLTALQTAEAQQVTEYQVIAERDRVTCPVCSRIDGRVFSVVSAVEKMVAYHDAAGTTDIKNIFPFPRLPDVDNKSPEEVRNLDLVPPFHPRCRCEMVMLWTRRISTTSRRSSIVEPPGLNRRLDYRKQYLQAFEKHKKPLNRDFYNWMGKKGLEDKEMGLRVIMGADGLHGRQAALYAIHKDSILIGEFWKFGRYLDGGVLHRLAYNNQNIKEIVVKWPKGAAAKKYLQQLGFKYVEATKQWETPSSLVKKLVNGEKVALKKPPGKTPAVEWVQPSSMQVPDKLEAALLEYEQSIVKLSKERGILFDTKGNVVHMKDGATHYVRFSREVVDDFPNRILTHNHPGEAMNPLSFQDVILSIRYRLKEIRAVTPEARHRVWIDWKKIKKMHPTWSDEKMSEKIMDAVADVRNTLRPKLRAKWKARELAGHIPKGTYSRRYREELWHLCDEKYSWFHYKKTDWPSSVYKPKTSKLLPKKYATNISQRTDIVFEDDIVSYKLFAEGQSTNQTYLVEFKDGSKGVYKPTRGERTGGIRHSIKDYSATLADRECLTWEIDDFLDINLVPETRYVKIGGVDSGFGGIRGTEGSIQFFKKGFKEAYEVANASGKVSDLDRFKTSILDFLTGSTDRHGKNWMINSKNKITLIDNGYTFPDNGIGYNIIDHRFFLGELRVGSICDQYSMADAVTGIGIDELGAEMASSLRKLDIQHLGSKWNLSSKAIEKMESRRDFMAWALEHDHWGDVWSTYKSGSMSIGMEIPENLITGWGGY